jgi:plasmid stabilization system protein ParE
MDYKVVWSPAAVEDVEFLAEYIAKDSEFYARTVVDKILAVARRLTDFPSAGRIVAELEDEMIRERFVYSYRLIYRLRNKQITILAVIHGKRLLDSLVERIQCT